MMKVHLRQLPLIKKDITRGQIPFCGLRIHFAAIKENWALNPFGARHCFNRRSKEARQGCVMSFFQKCKGSEKTSFM